ncbi:TPA: hypothetical protein I8564_003199 [Raoultella ornithinolytica]|nr:hypothetical protein [Raoultella ornithinolytica]
MTKSTITRERLEKIKSWRETYGAGSNVILPAEEAEELACMALAAMDSEPVAWMHSNNDIGIPAITVSQKIGHYWMAEFENVQPLYRHAQPAQETEREPIAWLNDAYLARGVVDGEAGSEDAGPGYIPVYREASPAQPAPVVPEEKPMPNHLSMYAVDAVAAIAEAKGWNACRAAMLQAGNSPVIPDGYLMVPKEATLDMLKAGAKQEMKGEAFQYVWQAMLAAAPKEVK